MSPNHGVRGCNKFSVDISIFSYLLCLILYSASVFRDVFHTSTSYFSQDISVSKVCALGKQLEWVLEFSGVAILFYGITRDPRTTHFMSSRRVFDSCVIDVCLRISQGNIHKETDRGTLYWNVQLQSVYTFSPSPGVHCITRSCADAETVHVCWGEPIYI